MAASTPIDKDDWLREIGAQEEDARCLVYLVTFSRLLPGTLAAAQGELRGWDRLSRKTILSVVRDSFEKPEVGAAGGRPSQPGEPVVCKLVAVRETHVDGQAQFHVAVLLRQCYRWPAVKRAIRQRHKLVAHFSCTHREWWSALRYITHTSEKKPVVDEKKTCSLDSAWRNLRRFRGVPATVQCRQLAWQTREARQRRSSCW